MLCYFAAYINAGAKADLSVVAIVEGEVTLPCGIDGDLEDSALSWNRIVDDTSEVLIYHSTFAPKPDEQKYAVSAHSLTIKDLEFDDGGYYKCSIESATSEVKQTAVIVVGTYTITQYIAANIIGAFTIHVVNGPTCSNFPMFIGIPSKCTFVL